MDAFFLLPTLGSEIVKQRWGGGRYNSPVQPAGQGRWQKFLHYSFPLLAVKSAAVDGNEARTEFLFCNARPTEGRIGHLGGGLDLPGTLSCTMQCGHAVLS